MRLTGPRLTAFVAVLLLLVAACASGSPSATGDSPAGALPSRWRSFAFGAAGDLGANPQTAAALQRLDRSDARFFLALGDLSYSDTPTERGWCRFVRNHLPSKGPRFPFELVVGNHEQDGAPDGRILRFARCLPDRLGARVGPGSRYGAEYTFDYPRVRPLARFVMVAPRMTVAGTTYGYGSGSVHRSWLVRQVHDARAKGIPWVVVGLHYPCISTGYEHGCDSGPEILNLLLREHVDLVLTGHNHIYERSKQLRLDSRCPRVRPERFNRGCIVDAGRDGTYGGGRGTVFVTAGNFGGRENGVNPNDGDARFFERASGVVPGFMEYTVSANRLQGRYLSTGGRYLDSFELLRR